MTTLRLKLGESVETVFTVSYLLPWTYHKGKARLQLEKVRPAFSSSVIVHRVLNKLLKILYSYNNNSIQVVSVLLSDLVLFQIWDFNGHCHHILMAGNGDPAEISQVLCLKRIIIVVGWDRYVEMSLTILSILLWLMLPWLSTFNYFSFLPVVQDSEKFSS